MCEGDKFDERFVHGEDLERPEEPAAQAAQLIRDAEERARLALWRVGDRRAGDWLIAQYMHPITRFFQAKVANKDIAIDLVAETFEQLTKSQSEIRSSVRAFIYGIARFTLFHHYRRNRRNREDLMDASLVELDDRESSFVQNQVAPTRLLLRAMRRISFEQAVALEMHYFEGMSGAEIAEILGVPEGTVRGRLRNGLIHIQQEILTLERSPAALQRSQSTYSWLAGVIRFIESRRGKAEGDPEKP